MIVVTGHLGFVGSHLVARLMRLGQRLHCIDLKRGENILSCHLPDADRVYHLAAQTDAQEHDAHLDAQVNIAGTLRILERYSSKVVFASSSMVNYPVTPYAISKRAAEDYARLFGAAVVRFCNLYGPGGHSVIDRFRDATGLTIRGTGEQLRTYAMVSYAVDALTAAQPGTLTILPGEDLTVNQIAARFPDKPILRVPALSTDLLDGRQL